MILWLRLISTKSENIKKGEMERELPESVVIIPIMNSPIFPGMIAPIILTEEKFTPELDSQILKSGYVALNLVKFELSPPKKGETPNEKQAGEEIIREVSAQDIYKVGVLCKVISKKLQAS